MSAADPSVLTRAEIIQASTTADWFILALSFLVFCAGFHAHAMLTMGDWDFWTDWKDRRVWPTVTPIMCITFPAAVQFWMWDKLRLPLGATFTILGLLFGEWVNTSGLIGISFCRVGAISQSTSFGQPRWCQGRSSLT